MKITGTMSTDDLEFPNYDISFDIPDGAFLSRRDALAMGAPRATDREIEWHGRSEVQKAKAKDTYIKQEFDHETHAYKWADKMIAASGVE